MTIITKNGKVQVFIMAILVTVLGSLLLMTFQTPLLATDSASCSSGNCNCSCSGWICGCLAENETCYCWCAIGSSSSCSKKPNTDPEPG